MGIRPDYAHSDQRPITPQPHQGKHHFGSGMWQKFNGFFNRDGSLATGVDRPEESEWSGQPSPPTTRDRSGKKVGVGLPRQTTFRRQNSEKRDKLLPIQPCADERRTTSSSRQVSLSLPRHRSKSTPPLYNPARTSAPAVAVTEKAHDQPTAQEQLVAPNASLGLQDMVPNEFGDENQRPTRPPSVTSSIMSHDALSAADDKAKINAELDTRWILNLSMHFRDKSDREKFFVTYAETPSKWRRVTVSCDYRNADPGSLEMDLKELQFQRDKSLQIYESIRDSLPEIQFYDTVTNLKLETSDGRLHVHVTEDMNEIIPYPPRSTVGHILHASDYRPREILESELTFDSHLSGFVYKVKHKDCMYIKKEIPGPDTVDEFLYEINALHALHDSQHVIRLEAIILDDSRQVVKGLLIGYAEQGAIVDLLYDLKGRIPWEDRLRWAHDVVLGLSEIHEEGYVQGDFTLSNIVVDSEGKAKIIDINRRGCPVGWEPPEIATKIASHQRISMYIGEKSDIYQLGMTLWGLAADDDEPERHDPPLSADDLPGYIPSWYKRIVANCLETRPRDRLSAKELATMFRPEKWSSNQELVESRPTSGLRTQKRYIDPSQAVERDDIERLSRNPLSEEFLYSPKSSKFDDTFTYPQSSTNYDRGSEISEDEPPRGRQRAVNLEHLKHPDRQHRSREEPVSPSIDEDEVQILSVSPGMRPQYDKIEIDGNLFLIARNTFSEEELQILERPVSSNGIAHDAESLASSKIDLHQAEPTSEPQMSSSMSSTSGSTPRNSQAIITSSSKSAPAHEQARTARFDDSLLGVVHSGSDGNFRDTSSQTNPDSHARNPSASPQPPPSLTYADSGFHEPLAFDEADDESRIECDTTNSGMNIAMPSRQRAYEPVTRVVPTEVSVRGSDFRPRPIVRTDTAIKVDLNEELEDALPIDVPLPKSSEDDFSLLETIETSGEASDRQSSVVPVPESSSAGPFFSIAQSEGQDAQIMQSVEDSSLPGDPIIAPTEVVALSSQTGLADAGPEKVPDGANFSSSAPDVQDRDLSSNRVSEIADDIIK